MARRRCARNGCGTAAAATLTYIYADSTAVLGPLAIAADPGGYDLCRLHSAALSVPLGWEVIRLPDDSGVREEAAADDLLALANAVREVGLRYDDAQYAPPALVPQGLVEVARRGHLTVLAEPPAIDER